MSQDSRGPQGPAERRNYGAGQPGAGGSVRRARERMEAGLPPERPIPSEQTKGPRLVRPVPAPANSSQARRQAPMPAALSAQRGNAGNIGAAISKPTPMAQWPLREEAGNTRGGINNPPDEKSPPRGPAPQRPPRPSHVPSLLDSSKVQEYTPSIPYRQPPPQQAPQPPSQARSQAPTRQPAQYYEDNNQPSPRSASTPRSGSSSDRPSTGSSVGTIPDFPVPAIPISVPAPARRSQNLGPPPLSRRGASSYYSQGSYVTPIPEENLDTITRAGGSFASSKVIPSSWGSQPDDFDPEQHRGAIEDEDDDDGRGSSGSKHDHDESSRLVRQASLGKKAKPALTTIKSSEEATRKQDPSAGRMDLSKAGGVGRAAVAAGAVAAGIGNTKKETPASQQPANGRMMLLDNSSSSSPSSPKVEVDKPTIPPSQPPKQPSPVESVDVARSRSPLLSPEEARAEILTGLEKGGMRSPTPGMSEKIPGTRRPPRLNIDAVKEAESRGSLTSLPDLIRRATKLASNLDRGRTASRLGIADMLNMAHDPEKPTLTENRRSGSISDILASFPPPGLATPTGERSGSRWPSPFLSNLRHSRIPSNQGSHNSDAAKNGKNRRRRVCGMPLWGFIILSIILFLLIAAAVVLPVTLIVIPRQHQHSKNAATAAGLTSCSTSDPCMNGGVSVVSGNMCQCICTNGFTGSRCTEASDAACTTSDITGDSSTFKNATVGNSIPRLLVAAQSNFSISLNTSQILSLFSANNLSCTSENALVTFSGQSQKIRRFYPYPEPEAKLIDDTSSPVRTGEVDIDRMLAPRQAVATSNGIVFATSTNTPGSSPTQSSQSSASSSTPSSTSGTDSSDVVSQTTIDFARVAVLFILQETSVLSSAVTAQEKIQSFFLDTSESSNNGSMGTADAGGAAGSSDNFTINFANLSITLDDGTVVGGKGPSSNVSARSVPLW